MAALCIANQVAWKWPECTAVSIPGAIHSINEIGHYSRIIAIFWEDIDVGRICSDLRGKYINLIHTSAREDTRHYVTMIQKNSNHRDIVSTGFSLTEFVC